MMPRPCLRLLAPLREPPRSLRLRDETPLQFSAHYARPPISWPLYCNS